MSNSFNIKIPKPTLNGSYTPILAGLLIIASFFLGSLWTKVQYLEKQTGGGSAQPVLGAQTPSAAPQKPAVSIETIKALFTDKNITFGDKNRKNLLVEVADPSCPYCHVAGGYNPDLSKQVGSQFTYASDGGSYVPPVPKMKELIDSGKAAFVWIYSPGHGNGEMGTKALYCAYEKGKFWQVHDKLMTNEGYALLNNQVRNDKTKSADLANLLADVFDAGQMKNCLDSGKYDTKLTEDTAIATSLGTRGTPGFFVNTVNFGGAYSWNEMQSALK